MSEQPRDQSRLGRAWHHHNVERDDQAIESFIEIIQQDPNDVDALYGLGLAQLSARQFDPARETFAKAQVLVEEMTREVEAERDRLEAKVIDESQSADVLERAHAASEAEMDALEARTNRVAMLTRMIEQQLQRVDFEAQKAK